MLKERKVSMARYLLTIPHGNFSIETRPLVRKKTFNKYAKIPFLRFFLALYFILKDEAFIRPLKPNLDKPKFYRRGLWKVHNCGQRKDGTFYTSGNAALFIYEGSKEIYDSTQSDIPFSELKERFGTHG